MRANSLWVPRFALGAVLRLCGFVMALSVGDRRERRKKRRMKEGGTEGMGDGWGKKGTGGPWQTSGSEGREAAGGPRRRGREKRPQAGGSADGAGGFEEDTREKWGLGCGKSLVPTVLSENPHAMGAASSAPPGCSPPRPSNFHRRPTRWLAAVAG